VIALLGALVRIGLGCGVVIGAARRAAKTGGTEFPRADHPDGMKSWAEASAMIVLVPRLPSCAFVLVLAVLAAGCGSKSSQPMTTADWADGVCSSLTTWKSSITSSADSLKGGNLSQDSLQSAGDDVKSATDTLESDLKDLGKPDTQSGQEAQDSINQLSSDLTTDTDSIKTAVDGVSGLSGVASAAATVSATLATMQSQITSTVNSLEQLDASGELKTAFQQSSSCQQLSSSS
jgi:hypothetical protein